MRYAILANGQIQVRALPTMSAARTIAETYPNSKVIIDPRSLAR